MTRRTEEPIIIGVTGHKRHGKDTIANRLVSTWGFEKMAFADALKDACAAAFGIDRVTFDDDKLKEAPSDQYPEWTHRKILQVVGTELFRSKWPNIWIDTFLRKAADKTLVVVSDIRFPNEEMALRTNPNFVLLRVKNERLAPSGDLHSSEAFIDTLFPDRAFTNNGTIDDLHLKVDQFMGEDFTEITGRSVARIYRNSILRSVK